MTKPLMDTILRDEVTEVVANWKKTPVLVHRVGGCMNEASIERKPLGWVKAGYDANLKLEAAGKPRTIWFCEICVVTPKTAAAKRVAAAERAARKTATTVTITPATVAKKSTPAKGAQPKPRRSTARKSA